MATPAPAAENVSIDLPLPEDFHWGCGLVDVECTVNIGRRKILTTVAESDSTAQLWVRDVNRIYRKHRGRLVVGLRLYRRFIYSRRGVEDNPFSVIVLCVGSRCLIYKFGANLDIYDKIGRPLVDFLRDTKVAFVGDVNIRRDVEKLRRDSPMLSVDRVYELQPVREDKTVMKGGDRKASDLEELAFQSLGLKFVDVPKPHHMVDSTEFRMSSDQMLRACFEAFLAFEIGCKIYG